MSKKTQSLAGARQRGAMVCATEGGRGHRALQRGVVRERQSSRRGDGWKAVVYQQESRKRKPSPGVLERD